MDSLYPASQSYGMYQHHQWTEDAKPAFMGDEHDSNLDDKVLEPSTIIGTSSTSESRRPSMLKVEDEFSATTTPTPTPTSTSQLWQERPHDIHPIRSFSTSHAPVLNGGGQPFMRLNDPTFTATIHHAHTWSVPQSGTSTPTQMYGQVYDIPYSQAPPGFATYSHDPASAISMSPQSSQSGWASATSSDGIDQRGMISPTYRQPSPGSAVRPDGIRKKNARFEIPKERNLANIDAMILASTDEGEKKELKQQKRLLRNRQAALDSRQRKKTHTEKLEQEKKVSEKKMFDMEEALARTENTVTIEREQFLQQRQHLENIIHTLQYERDEAISSRTLETAELRRQNNILKDVVRELESQQHKGYAPASHMDYYNGEMGEYDFENNLYDELDLIHDDLRTGEHDADALQRQTTPKPTTVMTKSIESKADIGFSWGTFYMCLLFGAFIASNNNTNNLDKNAASAFASSIPSTEASNVLKTVLNSGNVGNNLLASHDKPTTNGATHGIGNMHQAHMTTNTGPSSNLDHLHQSLASPSRRQEMAAAFSLSAASYQHITDPFNEHINLDNNHELEPPPPPQPSALQKAFASMQAQKDNIDKLTGMGSKARERSLLWDQVPPEVIKNFEALVQQSANSNHNNNAETMEQ